MAKEVMSPAPRVQSDVHELIQRTATVEERFKQLENKLQHLTQNMLTQHRMLRKLITDLDKDMAKVVHSIDATQSRVLTLHNEVLLRATKEELEVLRKYVDMWNPFQFVTSDQVEDIVLDVIRSAKKGNKS